MPEMLLAFPPIIYKSSGFSTSLPMFSAMTVFYFSHSDRSVVISHYGSVCTSLMARDAKRLFRVPCHLYTLFGKMPVHDFCPFIMELSDFFFTAEF